MSDLQGIVEEAPKPPTSVEELDRLRAENLQLRAMNLLSRKKDLLRSLEETDASLRAIQEETAVFKSVLASKYNIDFRTQQIESNTGNIVPAP